MPYILKNTNLEIQIDGPLDNYQFSRFDWTGKIVKVKFKGISLTSKEMLGQSNESVLGRGFYNEFGIDTALGFKETQIGDWFHKMGIGLLKKTSDTYEFNTAYEIQPAKFWTHNASNKLSISCRPSIVNGYGYSLKKTIELQKNGFNLHYLLENIGEKPIITEEYVHNFLAFNQAPINTNYELAFPFSLKPKLFGETVNPEQKVAIGKKKINFKASPTLPFFFSNLNGSETVSAKWTLKNLDDNIGISETVSCPTKKVNLWGWGHVISPELFIEINLLAGQKKEWTRHYEVFTI